MFLPDIFNGGILFAQKNKKQNENRHTHIGKQSTVNFRFARFTPPDSYKISWQQRLSQFFMPFLLAIFFVNLLELHTIYLNLRFCKFIELLYPVFAEQATLKEPQKPFH